MQWWNDFLGWLSSDDGARIITTAVVPFLAILIAGIVAAAIGRGSAKRVIALSDREVKASAVTALISAARKAAVWNTLPAPEQQHIDHLIGDADIRLRLLPVPGTALAADWASHEIISMKRNAVSFSFQAEQSLLVFRDRLIEWQARPSRAKRLFKNDLDSWAYDSSLSEQELVHNQQAWAAAQVAKTDQVDAGSAGAIAAPTSTAATTAAATAAATAPASKPFAQSRFSRPAAVPVAAPAAAPASAKESAQGSTASGSARTASTSSEHDTVEPEIEEPDAPQSPKTEHLEEIVVDDDGHDEDLPELVEPAPDEPRDVREASVAASHDENDDENDHGDNDSNSNDSRDRQDHEHHQRS
jgi:hypothetical protein